MFGGVCLLGCSVFAVAEGTQGGFCAFADAPEVFTVLEENERCGGEQQDAGGETLEVKSGCERGDGGSADGKQEGISCGDGYENAENQQRQEEHGVKCEDHAAKGRAALAALELHLSGKDVSDHRAGSCCNPGNG